MTTPRWALYVTQMLEQILLQTRVNNINSLEILNQLTAKIVYQAENDKSNAEKIIKTISPRILYHYKDLSLREEMKPLTQGKTSYMDEESSKNLRHWSALFHTDPAQTKEFKAPGGFQGTAISPTFTYLQLTEHFGPLGIGWGFSKPEFIESGELVFCNVECWYKDIETNKRCELWGVGGDRLVKRDSRGIFPDDDAYKKALTDALGNAFSRLGAGSDIRLGLYKDNKYIQETRAAFRETNSEYLPNGQTNPNQTNPPPRTISQPTSISKPPPLKLPES